MLVVGLGFVWEAKVGVGLWDCGFGDGVGCWRFVVGLVFGSWGLGEGVGEEREGGRWRVTMLLGVPAPAYLPRFDIGSEGDLRTWVSWDGFIHPSSSKFSHPSFVKFS
ncbi:hypothetical protein KC19_8G089100 [Ceratodon purpureus]|uniref:Uncharacterized protein n=1 Tax=Ceratodon purpureus TaxID=3225 RepID=A0A8T0GWN0_CERPU|nr:hypothetical protein KC19_8G089100 [Ceratodon purpureus]